MTEGLKPCPLSGAEARGPIEQGSGTWRIFGAGYFIEGPSREIVVRAWNTRPTDEAVVEKLEQGLSRIAAECQRAGNYSTSFSLAENIELILMQTGVRI